MQARRTRAALRKTTVCVRLHGSAEIRDVLDGCLTVDGDGQLAYDLVKAAYKL